MKKLIVLLILLLSFKGYSQPSINRAGGGQGDVVMSTDVERLALPSVRGQSKRARIIARAFEVAIASTDFEGVVPKIITNNGYGANGSYSQLYVGEDLVTSLQLSNGMVAKLEYVIDPEAEISVREAEKMLEKFCPTQYAAILSWVREYIRQQRLMGKQGYRRSQYESPEPKESSLTMYHYREEQPVRQQENNLGDYRNVTQENPPKQAFKEEFRQCNLEGVQEEYPTLTELFLQSGKLSSYRPIKTVYGAGEYRRVKHCVTGKSYWQRNAWWIVPTGIAAGGLITYGIISMTGNNSSSTATQPSQPLLVPHRDTNDR